MTDRDAVALRMDVPQLHDARAVAGQVAVWRMGVPQLALVDGVAGAVFAPKGRPRAVFGFTFEDDRIIGIDMAADPKRVGRMKIELLA